MEGTQETRWMCVFSQGAACGNESERRQNKVSSLLSAVLHQDIITLPQFPRAKCRIRTSLISLACVNKNNPEIIRIYCQFMVEIALTAVRFVWKL